MSISRFPHGVFATPLIGADFMSTFASGNIQFVDGDMAASGNGKTPEGAVKTIAEAITNIESGGIVYIKSLAMATGATDPVSYAENNLIIPADKDRLSFIGIGNGRVQGGIPQIKKGSGSDPHFVVRAPGCLFMNLGINGTSNTGGGILLDDDGSTKSAFGTTIVNCHFKNCQGSAAAATGGAIMWAATGGGWQVLIKGNRFYKNRASIVLKGTSGSVPQDVVIEDNWFGSLANTDTDCDIYLAGGSGISGLVIARNMFATVDGCAYATAPDAQLYVQLTGCKGAMHDNHFACIGKGTSALTFGAAVAAGQGGKVPTTVRFAHNFGEVGATATVGEIVRT